MSTRKKNQNNNHYIDLCTIVVMCSMGQIALLKSSDMIKIRDFIKCIKGAILYNILIQSQNFLGFHYESQIFKNLKYLLRSDKTSHFNQQLVVWQYAYSQLGSLLCLGTLNLREFLQYSEAFSMYPIITSFNLLQTEAIRSFSTVNNCFPKFH